MVDAPKGLHIFMNSSGLRSDLRGRKDMKLPILCNSCGKSLLLLVTCHWLFSSLRWGDTFNIKNNNFIFSVLFDLSSKGSVLVWGELGWKFSRAMWRFNLKWWFSYIVLKSNLWIKLPSQLHASDWVLWFGNLMNFCMFIHFFILIDKLIDKLLYQQFNSLGDYIYLELVTNQIYFIV